MKIVKRPDDQGGAEMRLAVVEENGRLLVYFLPPGTDKAQRNAPHFIAGQGIIFGNLAPLVDSFNTTISEFVCPDFADGEKLKQLRIECDELRRCQIDEQELEGLRADRAELERLREEKREIASLRTRLAELVGQ